MNAILKAPADLLFFGGIGTYVRAVDARPTTPSATAPTTRSASPARDLRCKVVGEGANLGMTQRGRIEAALRGVRLNTDAIDNSAGVNTSDIEVNIKIALTRPVRDGRLDLRCAQRAARRDDRRRRRARAAQQLSAAAVDLARRAAGRRLSRLLQQRLMQTLEGKSLLDRAVEYLPDDKEIDERRRRSHGADAAGARGAARLCQARAQGRAAGIRRSRRSLSRARARALFPRPDGRAVPRRARRSTGCAARSSPPSSPIRSSIAAGRSSWCAPKTRPARPPASIATAFAAVRDSYGMTALNTEIDGLDNKIAGGLQLDLYAAVQRLLRDRVVWFLRNVDLTKGLAGLVTHYRDGIAAVDGGARRCADGGGAGRARRPGGGACGRRRAARISRAGSRACRRSPPRPTSCWSPSAPARTSPTSTATYFAAEVVLPARPHHAGGAGDQGVGLFRPAGARPRARLRSATPSGG